MHTYTQTFVCACTLTQTHIHIYGVAPPGSNAKSSKDGLCKKTFLHFLFSVVLPSLKQILFEVKWKHLFNVASSCSNVSVFVTMLQIHVRGGLTIPMQDPAMTTTASRRNPYSLIVALDNNGASQGAFYLDDGESLAMDKYALFF